MHGERDAELLVWWMHKRLDTSGLPGRRHVLHVRFRDDRRLFWIVVESGVPSVCLVDPGFEVEVTVASDVRSLYQVWLGRVTVEEAVRTGRLAFEGASEWTRRMPSLLRLSPVAPLVRAAPDAAGQAAGAR